MKLRKWKSKLAGDSASGEAGEGQAMNRRMQWTAGLVLMVLSATASAQNAYLGYKMVNTRDYPFRYYIDGRASAPAGIALSEVEKATNAAFQMWEDASCSYADFQYMGRSNTNPLIDPNDVGKTKDAFNVSTVWVTSKADKYYGLVLESGLSSSGTLALTYAGYLYQCDIFLNAVDFKWTTLANTDPSQGFLDLQTVLAHEVGHCLGIADQIDPITGVMNPNFPVGGSRRALTPEDTNLICAYYPENGAVGSPCSASDPCTNGLTCIPFKNESGTTLYQYCSKSCTGLTNGECLSPYLCRDSTAIQGATKACLAVPGEFITQVGKACGDDPECGGPRSVCQTPFNLPSGNAAWVGGYCQEDCNANAAASACPAGALCTALGDQHRCLKRCNLGSNDCRPGYTCSPLPEGNACVPSCYQDVDCNNPNESTYTCRLCDRVCVENKATGNSVGEPCITSENCGSGLLCLFLNGNPQGVCAQSCSLAQCGCPVGSSCKAVGTDNVCMKDCAAGTCAAPLQCNPVGSSLSCTPACQKKADCSPGFDCFFGHCEDPLNRPDAGCTLCTSDGGTPPPPPPTDGGTGGGSGGGPGGCGCGQAPASALVLFGALALVLFSRRRTSWPRR